MKYMYLNITIELILWVKHINNTVYDVKEILLQ